jgi:DNA/RNA endonuclease YhcR with UshA esterase domain
MRKSKKISQIKGLGKNYSNLSQIKINDIPKAKLIEKNILSKKDLQKAFGYTEEDEKFLLNPMAADRNGSYRLNGN